MCCNNASVLNQTSNVAEILTSDNSHLIALHSPGISNYFLCTDTTTDSGLKWTQGPTGSTSCHQNGVYYFELHPTSPRRWHYTSFR